MYFSVGKSDEPGYVQLGTDCPDIEEFVRSTFRVPNPNYSMLKRMGKVWSEDQKWISAITPSGLVLEGLAVDVVREVKKAYPHARFDLSGCVRRMMPFSVKPDELVKPENERFVYRSYQEAAIRAALAKGRGTTEMATAGGKSLVIYGLIRNVWHYVGKKRVLLIVPNVQLVEQMTKDFYEYGYPERICRLTAGKDKRLGDEDIVVSNRQFVMDHIGDARFDMVIIDEVHQLAGKNKTSKFVMRMDSPVKFGFTGTLPPFKADLWNVIGICGEMLSVKKALELQDEGFIARVKFMGIKFIHSIDRPAGDPELKALLDKLVRDQEAGKKITDKMIEAVRMKYHSSFFPREWAYSESHVHANTIMTEIALKLSGNTIFLYDHIEHGDALRAIAASKLNGSPRLNKLFQIDGRTPVDYREMVRERMEHEDGCLLIANAKCFGTGTNVKNIRNICFAFPAGNTPFKIIQSIGRSLRLMDGKTSACIVDFFHDFPYSREHHAERLNMYRKNYGNIQYACKAVQLDDEFGRTDISDL